MSHDIVVFMEVKKKVKVGCEIGGTTGYREDVNIVNVDGDSVDGGCNGEVLNDGVIGEEEGVEGDGMMNAGIKSSTTRVIRTVLHHPCHCSLGRKGCE